MHTSMHLYSQRVVLLCVLSERQQGIKTYFEIHKRMCKLELLVYGVHASIDNSSMQGKTFLQ
jgi:hypothetical protein